ncbi:MAG TPA: hypothetical protein VFS00_18350, partial [Polyangiaceae bacterium]|nr:hypothetical protein [Polyangiaceae bacterium]
DLPTKASGFRFANGEAVTRPSAKLPRASSVPPSCRTVPASAALDSVTPPGHTTSARSLTGTGARRPPARAFEGLRGLGLLAIGAAGFFAFGTTVARFAPNQASAGGTPPASMTSAPLLSDVVARPDLVDATLPSTHAAPAPTAAPAGATPPSRQAAPVDATPPSPQAALGDATPPSTQAAPAPASAPTDVAMPPAQGAAAPSVTRGALAQPRALKPRRPLPAPASNAARAASAPGAGGRASATSAPSTAAGTSPARSTLRNDEPEGAN